MQLLPDDARYLETALDLASDAAGLASPNPTVGCVIMRADQVLGEGEHLYDNLHHAEIVALHQAAAHGHSVAGATAYVTLEPCAHHGRTGPCCDALVRAGIARCVVATVDPNPQVRGEGLARMRAAGLEVIVADPSSGLAIEARRLNDAFAFSVQHERPFVTLKSAMTIDGKIAPPPAERTAAAPHWLTGEAAREDVQHLRFAADAILTGIGTVLADDPLLTDRTGYPRRRPLLRVVLDRHLRLPLHSKLAQSAHGDLLVVCGSDAPHEPQSCLEQHGIAVVRVPATSAGVDLRAVLAALHQRRVLSVLVEAGSALNGSFLREDLVDRVVLYYSEHELGETAVGFAAGFPSPYVLQSKLTGVTRTTFPHGSGEDVRFAGYLHDPWTGVEASASNLLS